MNYRLSYSHHHGETEWLDRGLREWVRGLFDAPGVLVGPKSTSAIREHIRAGVTLAGWSDEFRIASDYKLTLFAHRDDLAFQLQTGNMSRAFYDLLKLQYLYLSGRIRAASLALPTKDAAERLGENIAHADRVASELALFDRVITVPIYVIAFE